jgi:hypothetical protein
MGTPMITYGGAHHIIGHAHGYLWACPVFAVGGPMVPYGAAQRENGQAHIVDWACPGVLFCYRIEFDWYINNKQNSMISHEHPSIYTFSTTMKR